MICSLKRLLGSYVISLGQRVIGANSKVRFADGVVGVAVEDDRSQRTLIPRILPSLPGFQPPGAESGNPDRRGP